MYSKSDQNRMVLKDNNDKDLICHFDTHVLGTFTWLRKIIYFSQFIQDACMCLAVPNLFHSTVLRTLLSVREGSTDST